MFLVLLVYWSMEWRNIWELRSSHWCD